MSRPSKQDLHFIAHLERYVPRDPAEAGGREGGDRAALAALRRGLGKEVGDAPQMYPYIVRALDGVDEHHEGAFYLIASLFALHPSVGPVDAERRANLGVSLLRLALEIEREGNKRDGVDRRMVALLNASPRDLPEHLRHAIGLLKSKDIAVDWAQLLRDVQDWGLPDHRVQRAWARAYWASVPTEADGGGATNQAGADTTTGTAASGTSAPVG
jgi:CRISPR system Cascade subunit CasB